VNALGGRTCARSPIRAARPSPPPFPNNASCSSAKKVCKKVLFSKKAVVCENSHVPNSKGDEAGTLKGLISNTHRDKAQFKKYSRKVYAKKKKIVHHTAMTTHNGSTPNAPVGNHASPSQTKVMVAM